MKKSALLFVAVLLGAGLQAQTQWAVDKSHAEVKFLVSHLKISEVTGNFKVFDGTLTSKGEDFNGANLDFTVDAASINTNEPNRDKHLQSPDFFDVAKYPTITFKSKSFQKVSGNKYKVTGDLTMHGVTKPVTLNVDLKGVADNAYKKRFAAFKVTGKVNRKDFGIANTPDYDGVVGEEVMLDSTLEFIKS